MLEVNSLVLILLITLIILILIFIIVLSVIGIKFLRKNESELKTTKTSQKIKGVKHNNDLLKALRSKRNEADLFCIDHPKTHSEGVCAISGEYYCELCLVKQDDIKIAKKYADIYLENNWSQVLMLPNIGISGEVIEKIVETKMNLWKHNSMPMIVQGHYKINVDTDEIEAFTVVMSRVEDFDQIKKQLDFISEDN